MWVHRLSNVDKVNKTATCSNCGQVAIVTSKTNTACMNRYKAHREKYNQSRRKGKKDKVAKNGISYRSKSIYIKEQKNKPCMDCGISYPYYVMDFDHRNPLEKSGNLAKMTTSSFEEIVAEIAKCDVVCANCHRERSYGKNSKPPTK